MVQAGSSSRRCKLQLGHGPGRGGIPYLEMDTCRAKTKRTTKLSVAFLGISIAIRKRPPPKMGQPPRRESIRGVHRHACLNYFEKAQTVGSLEW